MLVHDFKEISVQLEGGHYKGGKYVPSWAKSNRAAAGATGKASLSVHQARSVPGLRGAFGAYRSEQRSAQVAITSVGE